MKVRETADVVVVGGGVVGVSVAYHAAGRGAKVTLLEADILSSGASGAAAGMLNAQAEAYSPGPMLDLMLASREMHRTLGPKLYEETGLDPEHVWRGTLRVACDEAFATRLEETYLWQREHGLSVKWLSGDDVRSVERGVSGDAVAGLYLPQDGQVNSRRLVRAMSLAATRFGADIRENTPVRGLTRDGSGITGVETDTYGISAGCVVVAGGSVSGALLSPLGVGVPVFPIKGETLTLSGASHLLSANVWDDDCYVVPKRDGRVVVGATEVPHDTDRRPTLGGVSHLSGAAAKLLPELSRATFEGAWGGLRPGTPDEMPVLGGVDGLDGILLATGTYRNGILLAPAIGDAISSLSLGGEPDTDLYPFAHSKFDGP